MAFHALLRGEDRTEFTIELDATDRDTAELEVEDLYPEADVIEIFDPVERAEAAYYRAQRDYENNYYDAYD